MDYQKQIEDIIQQAEDKQNIQSFNTLGRSIAVFFFSLCNQGLKREEALALTKEYLNIIFKSVQK